MITIEVQHSASGRPARSIRVCNNVSLAAISRLATDHNRKLCWNTKKRCLSANINRFF